MTLDTASLFRPFRIKSLHVKNRFVMAPMTRNFAADGIPGEINAAYYRRRAEGGVGLILSEGTAIDRPAARNEVGAPFFHGDAALTGWKDIIGGVHAAGGRMAPQLWHVGSVPGIRGWEPNETAESPSGLVRPGAARGHAMSEEAIADTVGAFARAAADARRLGFDAVEIHGAHGYLIDQFFWAGTNERPSPYGGETLRDRARFASEVVEAIRNAVGPGFPIILRVSQWKIQDYTARLADSPGAMADWLEPLVRAGADILHCSQRRFQDPEFPEIDGEKGKNFAGWAKAVTGAATISVGSVGLAGDFLSGSGRTAGNAGIDQLVERMDREEFDLIAVGRALIGDPRWVDKIHRGETGLLKGFDAADVSQLI